MKHVLLMVLIGFVGSSTAQDITPTFNLSTGQMGYAQQDGNDTVLMDSKGRMTVIINPDPKSPGDPAIVLPLSNQDSKTSNPNSTNAPNTPSIIRGR